MKRFRTGCLFVLITFLVLWNPASAAGQGGDEGAELRTFYFNTPVRVLLERRMDRLTVASQQEHIHVKYRTGSAPWRPLHKQLYITTARAGTGVTFLVDGRRTDSSVLYLRGGPRLSDAIKFRGESFRGAIKLTLDGLQFSAVNLLPMEDYLAGILAAEMSGGWPLEALKAQAVASRSYALYRMKNPRSDRYDLERGVLDQVYEGTRRETPRVRSAVEATAGQYLSETSRPTPIFFHARCGGITDSSQAVWQGKSLAKAGVTCPFCQKKPQHWEFSVAAEEIASAFRFPAPSNKAAAHAGKTDLQFLPGKKSASGRWLNVVLQNGTQKKTVAADELRRALGYQRLRSTLFQWTQQGDQVTFRGMGAGHGVGMCQWGAHHFAEQGKSYREILRHFYPEKNLVSLIPSLAAAPSPPQNKTLD